MLWESAKCRVLQRLLPKLIAKGHKILIFSQWTTILDILEQVINSLNISHVRFDGSTAVTERQILVDTFQTDESIKVFLLSTRAGGMGINLTAADTVICHDLDFNPVSDCLSGWFGLACLTFWLVDLLARRLLSLLVPT